MSAVRAQQKPLEPRTRAYLGAAGTVLLALLIYLGVLVSQGLGLRGSFDATTTGTSSDGVAEP